MRIDPSQLSEPLAHILGAGATDAARGQQSSTAASKLVLDPQLERLDELLLQRMQAQSASDAATSVISFQDALYRAMRLAQQAAQDPAATRTAQGTLDGSRVRGLLD